MHIIPEPESTYQAQAQVVTNAGPLIHHRLSRRVGIAPLVKMLLVEALCRVSCWQRQVALTRIVRRLWPGFRDV